MQAEHDALRNGTVMAIMMMMTAIMTRPMPTRRPKRGCRPSRILDVEMIDVVADRGYFNRAVTTGSSITVIDLGEIAQPDVADRRQQRPGRANIGVAPDIVAKLVLAEEALGTEEPRCGLGTCGMQPAFSQG